MKSRPMRIGRGNRLVRAVYRQDAGAVRKALRSGFNPNLTDSVGNPALMLAVSRGCIEIAEMLLEAGANPNQTDTLSESALIAAIAQNRPDLVSLLLRYGADPDQESCDEEHGTTPRRLAEDRGYERLSSLFSKKTSCPRSVRPT